jgi:hypothetical protein
MRFNKLLFSCVLAVAITAPTTVIEAQNSDRDALAKHVLLISVDGMHALDLNNYIASHPGSTLAALAKHGIKYDNASTALPSDSFPGLAALITGGTPATAGLWYDVSYNRTLAPPNVTTPYGVASGPCPGPVGTITEFDESIDTDYTKLDGGGGINPDYLPRDPVTCKPIYPHDYLRVNTIFNVAKRAGLYTAWSDKHPAYEWVGGHSGDGLNDFYGPEINSVPVNLPSVAGCNPLPDPANATPSNAWTDSIQNIMCYDTLKVQAVVNWIDGKTHDGSGTAPIPNLFGMNFQAVSVGQKLNNNGYTDAVGTPSAGLLSELDFVDQALGQFVAHLKAAHVYDKTVIIVGAKHGQSPMDVSKRQAIPGSTPQTIVGSAYAFDISDDASLIWLNDQSMTQSVVDTLSTPASQAALGIQEIFALNAMKTKFADPTVDSHAPDIYLKTNTGVIFTGGSKIAEHGGINEDDVHVALLVSNPHFASQSVKTAVSNQQVAPTILEILGLNPLALQAVQKEGTPVLPKF